MKLLGSFLWIVAFVLSCIVSYHVTLAAAPEYMALWTISVVLIAVSTVCMLAGENS